VGKSSGTRISHLINGTHPANTHGTVSCTLPFDRLGQGKADDEEEGRGHEHGRKATHTRWVNDNQSTPRPCAHTTLQTMRLFSRTGHCQCWMSNWRRPDVVSGKARTCRLVGRLGYRVRPISNHESRNPTAAHFRQVQSSGAKRTLFESSPSIVGQPHRPLFLTNYKWGSIAA
jgi:hypothetical protein